MAQTVNYSFVSSVVTSGVEMARRKPTGERQVHPDGPMVDLDNATREHLKAKRIENGWSQRAMGAKIGLTSTAVSNIETGKTEQIHKPKLAAYFRAFGESRLAPRNDSGDLSTVERITQVALDLSPADQAFALAFMEKIKGKP